MDEPYQAAPDVHVLPSHVPIPGAGVLPINAFVLHAQEPVLIDTGFAFDGPDFMRALESVIAPRDLRWIWLTHDDADHTGSVQRIMELAPNARLATNAFSALRMAMWWQVPLERVHALALGDRLDVGDRKLRAMRPPTFDNPLSTGIFDESTGSLFSVDAFGALLPELTQNAADIPQAVLTQGMVGWGTFDSPWAHLVDTGRFDAVLETVRQLQPSRIFSSHLPPAGADIDRFIDVVRSLPAADPAMAPNQAAFEQMLAAMGPPPQADQLAGAAAAGV